MDPGDLIRIIIFVAVLVIVAIAANYLKGLIGDLGIILVAVFVIIMLLVVLYNLYKQKKKNFLPIMQARYCVKRAWDIFETILPSPSRLTIWSEPGKRRSSATDSGSQSGNVPMRLLPGRPSHELRMIGTKTTATQFSCWPRQSVSHLLDRNPRRSLKGPSRMPTGSATGKPKVRTE